MLIIRKFLIKSRGFGRGELELTELEGMGKEGESVDRYRELTVDLGGEEGGEGGGENRRVEAGDKN